MEHTGFPSAETLAEFIDGGLDPKTRRQVMEHMNGCDECYGIFVSTSAWRRNDAPPDTITRRLPAASKSHYVWIPATAAAILAVAFFTTPLHDRFRRYNEARRSGMADLVEAANRLSVRPIEGRLSAGFAHKPVESTRGGNDVRLFSSLDIRAAELTIERRAEKNPSAANLHALGVAQLFLGNYDEAISRLEASLAKTDGNDASLLNDLAAAYLARGRARGQEFDLVKASDAAERAWERSPSAVGAWNRAIPADSLSLDKKAADAWQDYLRLDPSSSWAEEARHRLSLVHDVVKSAAAASEREKRLDAAALVGRRAEVLSIFSEDPTTGARHAQTLLFDAISSNDETFRARNWTVAKVLGDVILEVTGDTTLRDTINSIDAAKPSDRAIIRNALLQLRAAGHSVSERRYADARAEFLSVSADLHRLDVPFAYFADYQIGVCDFYQNDYSASSRVLQSLRNELAGRTYISFLALTDSMRGLVAAISGDPYEGLFAYRAALAGFQRLKDQDHTAYTYTQIADCEERAGDRDGAWRDRGSAFALFRTARSSNSRIQALNEAAGVCLRQNQPHAALTFLAEAELETEKSDIVDLCDIAVTRAAVFSDLGDEKRAAAEVQSALALAPKLGPRGARATANLAEIRVALASESGAERRRVIDNAVAFASSTGNRMLLSRLRVASGLLHDQTGDRASAISTLQTAIDESEREARGAALSGHASETVEALYRELARLYAANGDMAAAFHTIDRGRDVAFAHFGGAAAVSDASRPIPPATAIVTYATNENGTLIFVRSSSGLVEAGSSATSTQLRQHANALSDAATAHDFARVDDELSRLSAWLVRPIANAIAGASQVVVVPDPVMSSIPFAALRESGRRQLIDRVNVVTAPSAAAYLRANARLNRSGTPTDSALIVGDPAVAPVFDLARLPNAAREAEEIAKLYPKAKLLIAEDATPRRFEADAPSADIIHIAGHASGTRENPGYSALIFTPDDRASTGALYGRDIAALRLPHAAIAVLGACGVRDADASSSVARAFHAAGVPVVVSALWKIDDATSRELLTNFHRYYRQGMSAQAALRRAQQEFRRSANSERSSPAVWAAFQITAGAA